MADEVQTLAVYAFLGLGLLFGLLAMTLPLRHYFGRFNPTGAIKDGMVLLAIMATSFAIALVLAKPDIWATGIVCLLGVWLLLAFMWWVAKLNMKLLQRLARSGSNQQRPK